MKKFTISVLAFLLIMSLMLCACQKGKPSASQPMPTVPTGGDMNPTDQANLIPFDMPENYECVLQVIMESIANLYLDSDGNIVAIQYLNEQAQTAFKADEAKIQGAALKDGIAAMAEATAKRQTPASGVQLILTVSEDEEGVYNGILNQAGKAFADAFKGLGIQCDMRLLENGTDIGEVTEPSDVQVEIPVDEPVENVGDSGETFPVEEDTAGAIPAE